MSGEEANAFERGKFEGQVLAVLARIEASIKDLTEQRDKDQKAIDCRLTDIEIRTTKLEQWRYWLLGAFAAIALLFTITKDYIVNTLFGGV
jgi:hypothetical protein